MYVPSHHSSAEYQAEPMVLPSRLDSPAGGFDQYMNLPSLEQPHHLNGDELVLFHHSMRKSKRASHLMAGAWCQIELAHVRDAEGSSAEAQELLAWAHNQAFRCRRLVVNDYRNHEDFFNRRHRVAMLGVYTTHFSQLGPINWPDEPTPFQKDSYRLVQHELLNPVMGDFLRLKNVQDTWSQNQVRKLKGILGQLLVLQGLNRLQAKLEYPEWSVAPASMREDCRGKLDPDRFTKPSPAFDVRFTFRDQTFIPIEVKWKTKSDKAQLEDQTRNAVTDYDSRVALVYVSTDSSPLAIARAMRNEINGKPSDDDQELLTSFTQRILGSMEKVGRQGGGLFDGQDDLAAAAAELSWQAFLEKHHRRDIV